MNTRILAAATAILGISLGHSAQAGTVSKSLFTDPSSSCQLSIPTTDTAVRPKATGYRNEGTKSAFVICGTSMFTTGGVQATGLTLQMTSFDGATHDVSCPAVSRDSSGAAPVYSTKSASFGTGGVIGWAGSDFGGTFQGFANSVTCTLPGGVAITGVRITFPDEIGT